MDKDKIKEELISEMGKVILQSESFNRVEGVIEKLEMWQKKLKTVKGFSGLILENLNKILERHNVEFSNELEKSEFIEYIKPSIQDLIVRHIKN
ncbi:hypothetical protein LZF95_25000 [Algoriphagus sp. AGSA1]|uniref:hypothetical protein n=1 Tax=Algoriphagus sp. AGSA1 TaxID=2907213 RepID=UPI001F39CD1E|nr:hypothetical protein [Algoriphagus sp. AGSA1]MCE7057967.1 hypothetical protein [Algoriphagus sp. AGSA1]